MNTPTPPPGTSLLAHTLTPSSIGCNIKSKIPASYTFIYVNGVFVCSVVIVVDVVAGDELCILRAWNSQTKEQMRREQEPWMTMMTSSADDLKSGE